jgi:transposase-like protein
MGRKYDDKLKAQVTHEICVERKSTSGVAKKYGVPLKTVEKWVTKYNQNSHAYDAATISDQKRIKMLEKENEKLKTTNELLKKTLRLLALRE